MQTHAQLLSPCPGHRPPDAGITLQSQSLPTHAHPARTCLAIDVTITTPLILLLPTSLVKPCSAALMLHKLKRFTEKHGQQVSRQTSRNNSKHKPSDLALMPFSVDPGGGSLGCFANCLPHNPPPPDEPPWQCIAEFAAEAACQPIWWSGRSEWRSDGVVCVTKEQDSIGNCLFDSCE
jgi:hypothetical protein